MKNKYTFYLLLLSLPVLMLLFTGYSAGQTAIQATGSPGDSNTTCALCHTGNADYGAVAAITTTIPDSGYETGTTYDITMSINTTQVRNGFQLTAEDADANKVGSFSTSTNDSQVANANHLVTHTATGNMQTTWTFQWTAPADNVGDITFYAATNASNNNGAETGDQIVLTNMTVSHSNLGINDPVLMSVKTYPNPVVNTLQIEAPGINNAVLEITDMEGRQVYTKTLTNQHSDIDVTTLQSGVYIVSIQEGNKTGTAKFIKK